MDKFPETNNFQKLNHQETKDLSKPTTKKEIQSRVKNLQNPKVEDQTTSLVILPNIREELAPNTSQAL